MTAEEVEKRFAQEIAEKATSDEARREEIVNVLATATDAAEMSKVSVVNTFQVLKWLREHAPDVQQSDLEPYFNQLASLRGDQVRCLVPSEVASIVVSLAACEQRSPELVRVLSEHSRRLVKHFSAGDIALVVRAYTHMSWRSTKTISMFGQRVVQMVQNPDLAPTVSGQHLRAIVASHARLKIRWDFVRKHERRELDMWKAIAAAVPSRFGAMSSRDFAVVLNAYAQLGFMFTRIRRNVTHMFEASVPPLIGQMAREVEGGGSEFRPRELALICNAYARINAGSYVQPLFRAISQSTIKQMDACNDQDVANILNGFAKLSIPDHSLFEAAAPAIGPRVVTFSPQALANVAHAYARQQVRHVEMFERIAEMSMRVMDRFTPQQLSNVAYAYGRVQLRHEGLLTALQDEVIYRGTIGKSLQDASKSYRFTLRSAELLTQAFARFGIQDQRLYFVLFDMVRQRVREFLARTERRGDDDEETLTGKKKNSAKSRNVTQTPEDRRAAQLAAWGEEPRMLDGHGLSVLLTAFAKGRANFKSLAQWAPVEVLRLQGQYSTWQLGTMFSACTKLGIVNKRLYRDMLGHAKLRLPQASPKVIAMLVRGMARAKIYNRVVMRQAVKVVSPKLADVDVVDAGALLVGCAELGYRDERFLRLLAAVVKNRLSEMSTSELSQAFASYAQMRIKHGKWFNAVLFELFRRQHEMVEKDANNAAYAMLLLNAVERFDLRQQEEESPPSAGEGPLYPFNKHAGVLFAFLGVADKHRKHVNYPSVFQMQIIELYTRLVEPTVYEDMPYGLKQLLAKARRVNVAVDDFMQNSSKTHRHISRWFSRVGLHHRSEVLFGPFMLDIVVGDNVVIEVDGPTHFYRDTYSRTSTSIMKHLLLTEAGFYVKHLPYQEWEQCNTAEKRVLYCASFWQHVLAAQQAGDVPARLPPLMDVVDMVVESQLRFLEPGAPESDDQHQHLQLGRQGSSGTTEPAFYLDDRDGPSIERPRGGPTPSDVSTEAAGTRDVEELLAAHERSEAQMARDRRRTLSAKGRWREEARKARKTSAADEWEQGFMGSHVKDEAVDAEAFHDEAGRGLIRAAMPRDRRRAVRHSGPPPEQLQAMEDTDDSGDDEAAVPGAHGGPGHAGGVTRR